MRARGWRPSYPIGSLDIAPGMPLITAFRWDTGVQVRVGPESIERQRGGDQRHGSDPRTRDNNGGKQIAGRVHWRPSAAPRDRRLGGERRVCRRCGAGDRDAACAAPSARRSRRSGRCGVLARSLDACAASSSGIGGRCRRSRSRSTPTSVFVEGRYKISPGLFVASRIDRLGFSDLPSSSGDRTWDAPVTRARDRRRLLHPPQPARERHLSAQLARRRTRSGAADCSRRSCISGCA